MKTTDTRTLSVHSGAAKYALRRRLNSAAPPRRSTAVAAAVAIALGVSAGPAALAQEDTSTAQAVQSLQNQVEQLQRQLNELQAKQNAAAGPVQTEAPASPSGSAPAKPKGPALDAGPLTLTFGGFTELAGIYRNRNETADVGSSFNSGIPYPVSSQYDLSEFRESARQSRFSLLAQGPHFDGATAEAYMETDFLGAAPTANSNESNSYNLRMRNFYGRYIADSGFYLLAGQSWSLATLEKKGMQPRDEDSPMTIDAQYVPGFTWTRNPQVRLVQKFNDEVSAGISFESPAAQITNGPNKLLDTTVYNNAGGSLFAPTNNYSLDPAPDVVAKIALDPGYGHYELFGLGRAFRSRAAEQNDTTYSGGVGGGLILPLVPKVLSFQASGLIGKGIGRYGSAQMPDVTLRPDGTLAAISGYQVLFGLTYTPVTTATVYLYAGREHEDATAYSAVVGGTLLGYGYGSPLYQNSGCLIEDSTLGCTANTKQIDQVTGGVWWKYYQGPLGNLQLGFQASYTDRQIFAGIGGAPSTNLFIGMVSFRYYPYQR